MTSNNLVIFTALGSLALLPRMACAQAEDVQASSATYTPARLLERVVPTYPQGAAASWREGWVILSYVVSKEGEVTEVMIEDSSGSQEFERAARRAVSRWRYSPAMLDGQPVEQSMTRARSLFVLDKSSDGASRAFVRKADRIQKLIREGDLEAANEMLLDLQYEERHNLYEDAWFWWLKYAHLEVSGEADNQELIESLQRAIGYYDEYLPPELFVSAVLRLYGLHVQELEFRSAKTVAERLLQSESASKTEQYPQIEQLHASLRQLDAVIEGDSILTLDGRVGRYDYWVHELSRRSFSLDQIQGEIEVVDIRCARGTTRYYSVAQDVKWSIPESWGDCGVYIKGKEGTTFAFYEHPNEG